MAFADNPYVVNIAGGSSSVPTTNVFPIAPPFTGMWAVWADVLVTAPGSTGSVVFNIGWNNAVNSSSLVSPSFSLTTAIVTRRNIITESVHINY